MRLSSLTALGPPFTLATTHVSYNHGRLRALDDVSIDFASGITALLGPNGAGKSTLLGCLALDLTPASGVVTVSGVDTSTHAARTAARPVLGYLPQRFDLVSSLTLIDTVAYAAWACGVGEGQSYASAMVALALVDLDQRAKSRVRVLSGGQRQRLGIAASVAHDPGILLLDEPTVGLDAESVFKVRRHIQTIAAERVVVIATHVLEDVSRMATHTVVLHHGSVVYDGSTSDLAARSEQVDDPLMSPLEHAYRSLLGAPE